MCKFKLLFNKWGLTYTLNVFINMISEWKKKNNQIHDIFFNIMLHHYLFQILKPDRKLLI